MPNQDALSALRAVLKQVSGQSDKVGRNRKAVRRPVPLEKFFNDVGVNPQRDELVSVILRAAHAETKIRYASLFEIENDQELFGSAIATILRRAERIVEASISLSTTSIVASIAPKKFALQPESPQGLLVYSRQLVRHSLLILRRPQAQTGHPP